MSTIERILSMQQTETEFWNEKRIEAGRRPTACRVTKILEGLQCACGQNCKIHQVGRGWFSEMHNKGCTITGIAGTIEIVGDGSGQACGRLRDNDGDQIQGVLILNGLWPHES